MCIVGIFNYTLSQFKGINLEKREFSEFGRARKGLINSRFHNTEIAFQNWMWSFHLSKCSW